MKLLEAHFLYCLQMLSIWESVETCVPFIKSICSLFTTQSQVLTTYQTTNFRKWKKVIQTGRKHCGNGEIACYEQFLLFPQCFQKACLPEASKGVIVWKWVNKLGNRQLLKTLWEKEKNTGKKQFLLFPQCFLSYQRLKLSFQPQ